MIRIYGVHGSPFVRKVYVALDLKGIDYETVPQMPFARDAEYQKINPLGKVPTLVDGDITLCDSKVICQYLEDVHPAPALYPDDPVALARARWYEELGGNQLSELGAGIFNPGRLFNRLVYGRTARRISEKLYEKRIFYGEIGLGVSNVGEGTSLSNGKQNCILTM